MKNEEHLRGRFVEEVAWLRMHPGYRLARPGSRVTAFLIDYLLFGPFFVPGFFYGRYLPFRFSEYFPDWVAIDSSQGILALLGIGLIGISSGLLVGGLLATPVTLILAFMLSRTGKTPGKWLIGLRVVRLEDPEERLGMKRAFVRQMFGMSIGWLFVQRLQRADHRSLQDSVAGTIVVRGEAERYRFSKR